MGFGYDVINAKTPEEARQRAPYEVGSIGVVKEVSVFSAGPGKWTVIPQFRMLTNEETQDLVEAARRPIPLVEEEDTGEE